VLDALVHRQDRQVTAATQAPVVEHLLQAAHDRRRPVGQGHHPIDEIRPRQMQALFGNALAHMGEEAIGLRAQQLDDVAHD